MIKDVDDEYDMQKSLMKTSIIMDSIALAYRLFTTICKGFDYIFKLHPIFDFVLRL